MRKQEYSWQNRSLKNIKGERWKNIPGLEGYFMISNFGRVKRLEYEVEFDDGRIYCMQPLIMKPHLAAAPNHFKRDHTFFLRVTLTLAKNLYHYSVARLVFYCFKHAFDLEDRNIFVVCRDMNGQNIRPSNLLLVDHQGRRMRAIKAGRSENILLRKGIREMGAIANSKKNGKKISSYDKKGNRVATYSTIVAAAAAVNKRTSGISGVLGGRKVTSAGYYWRYGSAIKIDIARFLKERKAANKTFWGKEVTQCNRKGKEITSYISINEASRRSGVCSTTIGKAVNGKAKSAGDFIWKRAKK